MLSPKLFGRWLRVSPRLGFWLLGGLSGLLLVLSAAGCKETNPVTRVVIKEPTRTIADGNFSYEVYVPDPLTDLNKKRPFFLLFHPAGSSGEEFIQRWIPLLKQEDAFILASSATEKVPYGSVEFNEKIWTAVTQLFDQYRIHEKKTFVIAESNGAVYAYRFLLDYSRFFKGAVLISAAIEPKILQRYIEDAPGNVRSNFLIVHGTEDPVFPVSMVDEQVGVLKQHLKDVNIEYRRVKRMGHGADPFVEDDILKWVQEIEKQSPY